MASTTRYASSDSSFEDATDSMTDWVRDRSRPIAVGVLAVVALGAGTLLWRNAANSKAQRAETAFFQAQAPIAQNDLTGAERELKSVAERFSGTAGGAQARLLLAQVYYDQGKYQAGIDALKAADAPAALKTSTKVLMAGGFEGLAKHAEAAKLYEEARRVEEAMRGPTERRDRRPARDGRAGCPRQDSNLRPTVSETAALST